MKWIIFLIGILFVPYYCEAQQNERIQNIILPEPSIDTSMFDSIPNLCGKSQNIFLNCLDSVLLKDSIVYTKTIYIQSIGAQGIELVFNKFVLSSHATVSIIGSFKRYEYNGVVFTTKSDSSLITNYLPEDNCIIFISIPIGELYSNQIVLEKINHYIIPLQNEMQNSSLDDYSCMINVNCPEGNDWCDQKRSVAMFLHEEEDGYIYICTGALVNNYRNNFAQYFLTARHCTNGDVIWNTTHFYFNYQYTFCNGGATNLFDYIVFGSQLVGYCDVSWSDNALLLITEPIPIQYNIYYAGVDITNRSMGDDVTCIHHSDGLPKKITAGHIAYFAGPKWDVYWDNGIIMSGGSGAPVFLNSNKRVIATISGGANYDCNSSMKHDWVGKVKSCMNYSDGIQGALFGDSGLTSYEGIDPNKDCQQNINLSGDFYAANDYDATLTEFTIQSSQTIHVSSSYFYDLSNYTLTAGQEIVLFPNTVIEEGAVFVAKILPCSSNLEACGTHSNSYKNENLNIGANEIYDALLVQGVIVVYPNPTSNFVEVLSNEAEIEHIEIYDMLGKLQKTLNISHSSLITIDVSSLRSGIYMLKAYLNNGKTDFKKIVINK